MAALKKKRKISKKETRGNNIANFLKNTDISRCQELLLELSPKRPSTLFQPVRRMKRTESRYSEAVLEDNVEKICDMIDKGELDINGKIDGKAPVMIAVTAESPKVLDFLLKAGAEVDSKLTEEGWTPVLMKGATPLITAAAFGHRELVKILISYDADVNATADNGMTALMAAEEKNNVEVVELLKKHGAK